MAAAFSRTVRAVQHRGWFGCTFDLVLFALFVCWLAWFLLADVAVHEVSSKARLEVQTAPHPLSVSLSGRVVETRLKIARSVRAGEVVLRLDAEADQLAIREHLALVESCQSRRAAVGREIEAEQETLAVLVTARRSAGEEVLAQIEEALAQHRLAVNSLSRTEQLKAKRVASEQEVDIATEKVETTRAKLDSVRRGGERSERDRAVRESEIRTRVAKLEREIRELDGTILVEQAAIRTLERQVREREIRVPVAGRLGDVATQYQMGSYVPAGARVGVVIPHGAQHIAAKFPAAALGRLRSGQGARLRLDGFPWVQYGSLPAEVRHVGGEPSSGLIQVELELLGEIPLAIPLEHGLTGVVEVQVERVTPVVLVLRAAGKLLTPDPAVREAGVTPEDSAVTPSAEISASR